MGFGTEIRNNLTASEHLVGHYEDLEELTGLPLLCLTRVS